MDLETYNDGGVLTPYCISLYDGISFKFFYLSDYGNVDELIRGAIKYLMQRKYNGYRVYLHNFSKFDGVFIVKYLTEFSDRVNITVRDTDIIKVNFHFGKYTLYFLDSYLMLPSSLKKLAKTFTLEDKGIFPYPRRGLILLI